MGDQPCIDKAVNQVQVPPSTSTIRPPLLKIIILKSVNLNTQQSIPGSKTLVVCLYFGRRFSVVLLADRALFHHIFFFLLGKTRLYGETAATRQRSDGEPTSKNGRGLPADCQHYSFWYAQTQEYHKSPTWKTMKVSQNWRDKLTK